MLIILVEDGQISYSGEEKGLLFGEKLSDNNSFEDFATPPLIIHLLVRAILSKVGAGE